MLCAHPTQLCSCSYKKLLLSPFRGPRALHVQARPAASGAPMTALAVDSHIALARQGILETPGRDLTLLAAIKANGWSLHNLPNTRAGMIAAAAISAAGRIYPYVRVTPLASTPCVHDGQAFLKLESEQVSGSFKARGAVSVVTAMAPEERAKGLVASSTGNHGLAVAYAWSAVPAADGFGCGPLRVFVPTTAVEVKVRRIREQGAEVIEHGDDCVVAEFAAIEAAAADGCVYASPYNDELVVAGQGTVALELLAQLPASAAADYVVFVPVGGGGLISGIAGVLKAVCPAITVVGCQPEVSQVMKLSVEAGVIVEAPNADTLSDGTAGGIEPESLTLAPCMECVDEWATASEHAIACAMVDVLSQQSKLVEGAAGVAVACAAHWARQGRLSGKTAVVIVCGGNVARDKLQLALQMAEEGA